MRFINRAALRLIFVTLLTTQLNMLVYADDIAIGKTKSAVCVGCHGANGIGVSAEYPNLAGQKSVYLKKQLKAFRSGQRVEPTMNAMTKELADEDIQSIAAYYASLGQSEQHQAKAGASAKMGKPTVTEFPETTYITMKKSGNVETFPDEVIWQGGPNMLYNSITPDGKLLLATSPSGNNVYVFDAKSGKQKKIIAVGKAPKGVKVSPDGQYAYVSNQGSAEISVIDLKKLKVVDTIKVEKGPHNARFNKDGSLAYVTLQGGAGVAVIDTNKRKMVRIIPVPGITGPHNLDLSSDEQIAFVRDFVHNVAVLDLKTGKVKKIIKVGTGHGGIDVAPNGRYAVTAAIGADFISVINTKDLTVKNIKVGNGPHGVRASKDSRWIYVTVTKENKVVIIDATTMTVKKEISVQKFPFWIAVKGNP
ncbi:Cytochrome c4 [hydrothermal vent metagenome]|uniref:Cytochrome c4 n=1 Tax=hydrothermal vent metagenome TaxID=652676 RepID=A0A3B1B8D2_9ZZZZ